MIPFAYVFGGWKGVRLFVRLLPLLQLASAFAISKDGALLSWTFPIPAFGYLLYVLFQIITTGFTGIQSLYDF